MAVNPEAKVEALLLATRGSLDPARALEAIGAGAAASWQLNNLGPKIIARDYWSGFLIKLLRKDLRLVERSCARNRNATTRTIIRECVF